MPTFQREAEPVTQIVCKAISSPAAAQSSVVSDTQGKQQQQLDAEQEVQDIADLVSEIIANGTEQVCVGDNCGLMCEHVTARLLLCLLLFGKMQRQSSAATTTLTSLF